MRETVSVVIATYNEVRHIEDCVTSVVQQTYPHKEVIIVDGMSDDGTREKLQEIRQRVACVRMLDNPRRRAPFAFNIGVENSRGEIICILGAHAVYPDDYLERCVELHRADAVTANVGGRTIVRPGGYGPVAEAVAGAVSHRFGVGNAEYRLRDKPGYVESVFPGCYKRSVFGEIGLFDERLYRGQDQELNLRIAAAGRETYFDPGIEVIYYARASFTAMITQYFRTGRSIIYTARVMGRSPSYRQFVPLLFVGGILLGTLVSLLTNISAEQFSLVSYLPLAGVLGPYLAVAICVSAAESIRRRRSMWLLPVAFFLLHASYGLGSLAGLITLKWWWGRNRNCHIRFPVFGQGENREVVSMEMDPAVVSGSVTKHVKGRGDGHTSQES